MRVERAQRVADQGELLALGRAHDWGLRRGVLAQELAAEPQVSMRLLKRSVYQAAELSFEQACEDIAARTAISDHHPDAKEGGDSFREKRSPSFNEWLRQYE